MNFRSKLILANTAGRLARRAGRGGTSLPGKFLLKLEPHAIARLARRLKQGNVVISATNGKTTTSAMIASVLQYKKIPIVYNRAGANMTGGIAATLARASRRNNGISGELGLFEVDEFWLPPIVDELEPKILLLSNLFRDQLDRYGELDTIADRWKEVIAKHSKTCMLVLNCDDPLVAHLGSADYEHGKVIYFGVEDPNIAGTVLQHASDSKHCHRCGSPYIYDAVYLAHLGKYHCPNCGAKRPTPTVVAEQVQLHGIRSSSFVLRTPQGTASVDLSLPGLYNVYNALSTAALCYALDIDLADIAAGLTAVKPAFGRAEQVVLDGRSVLILLIKNPAGSNEVLRTLASEEGQLDIFGVLNDRAADGRDVSWVWDADWEQLVGHIRMMTCSGTRAAELALRMHYAGVDPKRIRVIPKVSEGLEAALADGKGPLYALPTYTGMLDLHNHLATRDGTKSKRDNRLSQLG